jgi:hypothetical protein
MRYKVFMDVKIMILIFWMMTLCNIVDFSKELAASILRIEITKNLDVSRLVRKWSMKRIKARSW